jgi:tetratricopeptide (TPR) repeat protein
LLAAAASSITGAQEELITQLQNATALHEQTDYAHSIPILKEIVRQSPRSYEANLLLGEDLIESGSIQQAIAPLETAARLNPQEGTPEVYLAEAATALKDYPRAVAALEEGVVRSKGGAPFLESLASFCIERYKGLESYLRSTLSGEAVALRLEAAVRPEGNPEREKLLEHSAVDDPDQLGIWGELGLAQLELGMISPARESLIQAEKREPQGLRTLQLEALLASVDQKWPVAEARLTEVAARSPMMAQGVVGIWQYLFAPKYSTAGASWECLRSAKAACPVSLLRPRGGVGLSAKQLYAQERWEQLAALPAPPATDTSASFWHGVALAKTGNCVQAIPQIEYGMNADERVAAFWADICYASEGERTVAQLTKQGNAAALHQLRGDIMIRLSNDAVGAEAEYLAALKDEPQNPHFLERLAKAYMQEGKLDQARTTALAALAADPHNFSAQQTLAQMGIQSRNYEDALVWLKKLEAMDPKDQWTQVDMGVAYAQLGQPEEALRHLGPQLAAGYPDNKGAFHAQLASILRKLGRIDEAKQAQAEAERLADASLVSGEMGGGDAHQ